MENLQQNTKLSVYQLLQETDFVNQFPVVLIKTYLIELYVLFFIKLNSPEVCLLVTRHYQI